MINVVIIDDHPVVRAGLRTILDSAGDIHVVAEAARAADALRLTAELQPDVLVLDVNLPDGNGIDITRSLCAQGTRTAILILTIHRDPETIFGLLECGAVGYVLKDEELNEAFERFKRLADQKKDIFDEDIEALVSEGVTKVPEFYSLIDLHIISGVHQKPTAAVKVKVGENILDKIEYGDGPVDATYKAIVSLTGTRSRLLKFEVKGITGGTDALGEVVVSLEEDDRSSRGHGADTDIIVAAAKAYINALNKLEAKKKQL